MRKPDIMTFTGFTDQQKQSLNHILDFLDGQTDDYKNDLAKGVKTLAQVKQDVINADEAAAKNSIPDIFRTKRTISSQEGRDYNIIKKYTLKTDTGVKLPVAMVQLISNYAFREESCNLGHCVGRAGNELKVDRDKIGDPNNPEAAPQSPYYQRFKTGRSVILSLKRMDDTGQSLATMEIANRYPTKQEKKIIQPGEDLEEYDIVQIRGPHNNLPDPILWSTIRSFFDEHNISSTTNKRELLDIGWIEFDDVMYNPDGARFKKLKQHVLLPEYRDLIEKLSNITNSVETSAEISMDEIKNIVDKLQIYPGPGIDVNAIKNTIIERIVKALNGSAETSLNDSFNRKLVEEYLKILTEGFRYGKI